MERLEQLQRKFRPKSFKKEFCNFCKEEGVDLLIHVCNPAKKAEAEAHRQRWEDPWQEQREAVLSELRPKLEEVLVEHSTSSQELMEEILKMVTPYLYVGGPVG